VNRRSFVSLAGAAAALPLSSAAPVTRPNILYIMTDQQWANTMSCAGNADLRTPAMDSLAADGVRFEQAYCSNPLCVPSRTSMLTGKMPWETGVTINKTKHDLSAFPMMGTFLSGAGYDCGYFGKWHIPIPATDIRHHGFSTIEHARGAGVDADVPDASIQFLRRKRDKPFLMVSSFLNPHDICEWARGQAGKEGPYLEAPPPDKCPQLPANFAIPGHEPDIIREVQARDKSAYPTREWTPDKWRQYRWAYCRLTEAVDARIGLILNALKESGQYENTLIVFASDHGDGNAAHHWNQKQILYDEAARVPFVVSGYGVKKPGSVNKSHLVNAALDLIPTFCDYAGIATPSGLTGSSVRALVEGKKPSRPWRDSLVVHNEFCLFNKSHDVEGRMLRTRDYTYVAYSKGEQREQLTDVRKDPGEMHNLAVDKGHKQTLARHRRMLADACSGAGDRFIVPSA